MSIGKIKKVTQKQVVLIALTQDFNELMGSLY